MQQQFPEIMKAKLFNLTEDNDWEDLGIGFPSIEKKQNNIYHLVFYREETNEQIHNHQISSQTMEYEQSDDKVVSFCNNDQSIDMAISFQNQAGSTVIWDKIQEAIGESQDGQQLDEEEDLSDFIQNNFDISVPNMNNLETILAELTDMPQERRLKLTTALTSQKIFLNKFIDIFNKVESNKDMEKLDLLCKIMRLIILYAEHELYELLLSDELYLTIFGILEYDPDVYQKANTTHREFFKNKSKFIQVVDFKDEKKEQQIHFNFRICYLKDCALAHFIDDRTQNLLTLISQSILSDLITYISSNKEILGSLADKVRNLDIKALKFLNELFSSLKNMDNTNNLKKDVVEAFNETSIFEIMVEDVFQNITGEKKSGLSIMRRKAQRISQKQLQEAQFYAFEILLMTLNYQSHCLQQYAINDTQKYTKYPFISFLVDNFIDPKNQARQIQCFQILRGLLTNDIQQPSQHTVEIAKVIIDTQMKKVVQVFEKDRVDNSDNCNSILRLVLEFFIYLMKAFYSEEQKTFDKIDMLEELSYINDKILIVFDLKCKYLISKAIYIYKLFCECNTDEINKTLYHTVVPVTKYLFEKLGKRQNLIFSQILELVTTAWNCKLILEEEAKQFLYGKELETTYYEQFEEEFLRYIRNKNYKYLKQLVLLGSKKHVKDGESDVHMNSKKNSECYSDSFETKRSGFNIDALPPIPSGVNNVQGNTVQKQLAYNLTVKQKTNEDSLNIKRKSQNSKLVDYEEEDEDSEEHIGTNQNQQINEDPQKKVKTNNNIINNENDSINQSSTIKQEQQQITNQFSNPYTFPPKLQQTPNQQQQQQQQLQQQQQQQQQQQNQNNNSTNITYYQ